MGGLGRQGICGGGGGCDRGGWKVAWGKYGRFYDEQHMDGVCALWLRVGALRMERGQRKVKMKGRGDVLVRSSSAGLILA